MKTAHTNWMARTGALPGQVATAGIAQIKKRYRQLKNRYGPKYTKAMVLAAFITLFVPIPGAMLGGIGLIVLTGEVHRTISKRLAVRATITRSPIMPSNCDIILQPSATPEQLAALGTALWGWCNRTAGDTGVYQYLDNQGLADMIAGKFPAPSQGDARQPHFRACDRVSHSRQAAIDTLRVEIPSEGVQDVVVDGVGWNRSFNRTEVDYDDNAPARIATPEP
jgi:hypothetical protein